MGATYRRRGKKSWLVTVHWHGERETKTVHSEADAKALVQLIHRQELAGVNVVENIRKARAATAPEPKGCPQLRDALPQWIDEQVARGEFRASTGNLYRRRLRGWAYLHELPDGRKLGDLPVDQITRDMLGAVILGVRNAGRSRATIGHIIWPLKGYYRGLIEMKVLAGPNPAADLKFFVGKATRKKAVGPQYFAQEEGPALFATAEALFPRWRVFIMTGVLAGLRWGESAALFKSDIDWTRGVIHVQRTLSEDQRMEAPKDHDGRHVKVSAALLTALRAHTAAKDLEGQVNGWTPEQRRLVFPNTQGRPMSYTQFLEGVWQPLLAKAGLPYRRYHATRHTFATWLLSERADLRWVQHQLGHASIKQTADTYGHVQPQRHESVIERLDKYVQ